MGDRCWSSGKRSATVQTTAAVYSLALVSSVSGQRSAGCTVGSAWRDTLPLIESAAEQDLRPGS